MDKWLIGFIILACFSVLLLLEYIILLAYYRVKYVVGTKNKFRRQIEEILENHVSKENFLKINYDITLVEELTELISGEKIFKN